MAIYTWEYLLAPLPIVTVLVLMAGLRWGGAKAAPVAWAVTVVIAVLGFGAGSDVLLYSQVKALLQSLTVLYIIWMGLLLYNAAAEAGAIHSIGQGLSRLTADPIMQMIILAWAFGGFLEGASGFGVPVAVAAPLLIGVGIPPVVAVVGALVGHSWAVALGNVGTSYQALITASRVPGEALAPWAAAMAGVACLGCGFGVVHAWGGWRAIWQALLPILAVGGVMAGMQYVLAVVGLWSLASFGAGLVGILAGMALARYGRRAALPAAADGSTPGENLVPFGWAVAPYLLLIAFVLLASLIPPVKSFLNHLVLQAAIPETRTALGWAQGAEVVRSVSVFGSPGALLAYTALLSLGLFAWMGRYDAAALRTIGRKTLDGSMQATIGITAMVGLAALMEQSGMSYVLAEGLSRTVGGAFPLFSAFIGGVGAFITGSGTSSNLLLAPLQRTTADLLGISATLILGAQANGGGLGGMVAPAKVIVGCSTAGLASQEGRVLRQTLGYAVPILGLLGVLTWLAA